MMWTEEHLEKFRQSKPKRCETCRYYDGLPVGARTAEALSSGWGWSGRCCYHAPPWPEVFWSQWCGDYQPLAKKETEA